MFKQDNKEGNKARLFSHRAEDVIPLLYGHLPKSLPVLSTILANSLDSTRTAQPGNDLESSPPVYLTFPVEDLIQPPDFWVAIIPTWQAREPHARIFVSPLPASPASSSSAPAPSPIVSPDCNARSAEAESRAAESLVHATAVALVDLLGPAVKLGAVPTEWADVVRAVIGGEDNEECSVFLAPSAPTSITSGPHSHPITNSREEGDELDRLRELGLVWDRGREEDLDIIKETCDVARSKAHYRSRLAYTTVLRHCPSETEGDSDLEWQKRSEPVSWVITHSDGSLGTLYTVPTWRRKGLGQLIMQKRLKEDQERMSEVLQLPLQVASLGRHLGDGVQQGLAAESVRGFCYVYKSNAGSRGLMRSMGWEDGWGVKWVYRTVAA